MNANNAFNPLVSIVIPVYNGANFMKEAIDSALNQTYKNCEVIVVNDGSSDNGETRSIAVSYGDKIRYFEKENGGVASAVNLGIHKMKGDYFSWLSHDDIYYPNKIETQVMLLNEAKDKNIIIYSDWDKIDERSNYLFSRKVKHVEPKNFQKLLILDHPVNGNTVLIPKAAFIKVGYFDESLKTTQDYNMWHRLSFNYPFIHLSQSLAKNRIHMHQGTLTDKKFISESNSTKIVFLNEFTDNDLLALFNEKSVKNLFTKLILNFSLRGGVSSGLPTDYLFERLQKIDTNEVSKKPKYYLLKMMTRIIENRYSRKVARAIYRKMDIPKFKAI